MVSAHDMAVNTRAVRDHAVVFVIDARKRVTAISVPIMLARMDMADIAHCRIVRLKQACRRCQNG